MRAIKQSVVSLVCSRPVVVRAALVGLQLVLIGRNRCAFPFGFLNLLKVASGLGASNCLNRGAAMRALRLVSLPCGFQLQLCRGVIPLLTVD